jgi:hypothetical protein
MNHKILVGDQLAYSFSGVARFYGISCSALRDRQRQNRLPPHDLTYGAAGVRYWWRSTLEQHNLRPATAKPELVTVIGAPLPSDHGHTPITSEPDA